MPQESWTLESLREHLVGLIELKEEITDAKLSEIRTLMEAIRRSTDQALTKSELASEKRFEGINEFRQAMLDQQRTYMPRQEAELVFTELRRTVAGIQRCDDQGTSRKSGMKEGLAIVIAVTAGVISIVGFLLNLGKL